MMVAIQCTDDRFTEKEQDGHSVELVVPFALHFVLGTDHNSAAFPTAPRHSNHGLQFPAL